ncbi:hypothetical protein HK107_12400 [Parvularcula sp. ZS-1/3]|uniref:Yip1 domain-containing protein n=1 Tax=Parvularcula mediterranea TaxID=2732508 RepID=A0A7Y3W638_9PROT|nr:hypothetical protein [Parvularcula mediterranea]NNU17123.1 hypothetical protein [Parvularcula mediterranea]
MDQRNPHGQSLGSDELVEDLFGLNVRGLRTLRDMVIRPARVFEAARRADWRGEYTPSVRLVFSILTLLGFLSFFWAGEDTAFFEGFSKGFADGQDMEEFDGMETEVAQEIIGVYSATLPFLYLIAHGFISQVVRVWGAGTDRVTRLRLHMASIVPSMALTLIATMLMPLMEKQMALIGVLLLVGTVLVDFATSYRGGVVAETQRGRLVKASVFALGAATGSIIASALSLITVVVSLLTFIR